MTLTCAAFAQTATSPQSKKPAAAPAPKAGSATAKPASKSPTVITIDGLCVKKVPGAPCRTVVTRDDFERIARLQPNLTPPRKLQLAHSYVEALTFANAAEKAGLDKKPEFQSELREQMQLLRLQMLYRAYGKYLQEESSKIPDAELEKSYSDNKEAYQEVTLKRIYIPKPTPAAADKKPPMDEAATKALAQKTQQRAAAGEPFDKLEEEAFSAIHPDQPKGSAPPTDVGARRRGSLPPQHETKIFQLKPGQVTSLIDEPSGYFIYKVEAVKMVPFEEVKSQISRQLQEQKFRDAVEQMMASEKITYNEQYFTPPQPPKASVPEALKAPEQGDGPKQVAPQPAQPQAAPAPAPSATPAPK